MDTSFVCPCRLVRVTCVSVYGCTFTYNHVLCLRLTSVLLLVCIFSSSFVAHRQGYTRYTIRLKIPISARRGQGRPYLRQKPSPRHLMFQRGARRAFFWPHNQQSTPCVERAACASFTCDIFPRLASPPRTERPVRHRFALDFCAAANGVVGHGGAHLRRKLCGDGLDKTASALFRT